MDILPARSPFAKRLVRLKETKTLSLARMSAHIPATILATERRSRLAKAAAFSMGFALAGLAWSYANYRGAYAEALGTVELSSEHEAITAAEPGRLAAIHVKDGQRVHPGEVLAELEPQDRIAEREALEAKLKQVRTEISENKLAAEAVGPQVNAPIAAVAFEEAAPRVELAKYTRSVRSELEQLSTTLDELAAKRAEAALRRERARSTIEAQKAYLGVLYEEFHMRDKLAKQNADSRVHVLDVQKDVKRAEIALSLAQSELGDAEANLSALDARATKLKAGYVARKQQEANEAESLAAELEAKLAKLSEKNALTQVTASKTGVVRRVSPADQGRTVASGEILFELASGQGAAAKIIAFLPKDEAALVQPDQEAVIKINALGALGKAELPGRVVRVVDAKTKSQKPASSEPAGRAGEPFYEVQVAPTLLPRPLAGGDMGLKPGMLVSVAIKTDKRRFMDYFLAPFDFGRLPAWFS